MNKEYPWDFRDLYRICIKSLEQPRGSRKKFKRFLLLTWDLDITTKNNEKFKP